MMPFLQLRLDRTTQKHNFSPADGGIVSQREILKAIARGRTTKQIAFDLGLSTKTIETHRAQIMERLDIHDVAGLVRFSIRMGLVSAHD